MLRILALTAAACALCLAACAPIIAAPLAEDAPRYVNARYGFSLLLPPGRWEATESANGDGAALRSPDWFGVEVLAYGTTGYAALGKDFDAALEELSARFATVGHKEADRKRAVFSLWGVDKEGRTLFITCCMGKNAAQIVQVANEADAPAMAFEQVCAEIRRSFTPGF